MNTVYLLIMFVITPIGIEQRITIAYFRDIEACQYALVEVKKTAKYINGVCVPESIRSDRPKPGKFGPT